MTFTTFTFFVFAALAFAVYWALPTRRAQNVFVLLASYVFYGWWDLRFCLLVFASSAVDYSVGRLLDRTPVARSTARRWLLALSIASNLGILAAFKYYGFFTTSAIHAAASIGLSLDLPTIELILPVGISFYTFQTLGYSIDVYRGDLKATRDLVDYFAYVAFFPQLVAGPIERGARLLPQFARPRAFAYETAVGGARLVLWGFVQKAALADNLATLVDQCYGSTCSGPLSAVATICFAFQIYWDFAGYSNMAIGTAALFGFSLSRNFAYPYFSQSIAEFWRRWHMTLSTWFRDYVYVPLGGSRHGLARTIVSALLTFAVSGLWHGAATTFIVWGLLHGALTLPAILWPPAQRRGPDDLPGGPHLIPPLAVALRMGGTFALVCFGWVFFRAPSLGAATAMLATIAADAFEPAAWAQLAAHADYLRGFLPLAAATVMLEWATRDKPHPLQLDAWPRPLRWLLYTALMWGTLYLLPEDPRRFVYFQF